MYIVMMLMSLLTLFLFYGYSCTNGFTLKPTKAKVITTLIFLILYIFAILLINANVLF